MKSRILSIVLALLVFTVVSMLLRCSRDEADYVLTVKSTKPYESIGIDATYKTVFEKYIESCKWNERIVSKELAYVDVSGKLIDTNGTEIEISITFRITPYEGKTKGNVWIEPYIIEIDKTGYEKDTADEVVEVFFDAYDIGYDSMAEYYYDN